MSCKCTTETLAPNATPTTPYFPGIRRFKSTRIVSTDRDCIEHGWRIDVNVAAIIRYCD